MMNFNSNTSPPTTPSSFSISNSQQVPTQQQQAGIPQQPAKINDDKSGASPINPQSQQPIHSGSQNNNNHGLGGTIPQQLINMQQQQQQQQQSQNINRNINVPNQQQQLNKGGNQYMAANYNYKPFVTNTGHNKMQPSNQFAYQQQQQQQQQQQILPPSTSASLQHQNVQHSLVNQKPQTFIQKLQDFSANLSVQQHTNMQPQIQQGNMQQNIAQHQMKMANINYGQNAPSVAVTSGNLSAASPPLSANQPSMQFSPTKSTLAHPQMKKTPTLASPGSQLQKSPPLQAPAVQIASAVPANSQQASQNKNVPLPVGSNVAPPQVVTPLHPPPSSQTTQAAASISISSPNKQQPAPIASSATVSPVSSLPTSSPNTNINHSNSSSSSITKSVPSQVVQTENKPDAAIPAIAAVQTPANEPSTPVASNAQAAKIVDQTPASEPQNKSSPAKPAAEEKKVPLNSPVGVNKTEKSVASPPAPSNTIPKASAMRLATVAATPTRKKPPPTITKKVTATSAQQKTTRSIQPPLVVSKPVENDKTPTKSTENTKPSIPANPQATSSSKKSQETSPKSASGPPVSNVTPKTKRVRTKVQPYQSPTPEITLVTKLSTQAANSSSNSSKNGDDKLTIFYKSEFLAVRNGEGTFYLCQAMHNVYKSSPKIKIRWLNEKNEGKVNENGGRVYNLDFYDLTDFECVLTTVDLEKIDGKTFELPKEELTRIESILKKAIDVEKGVARPDVTEENPDGLDLSLYKDESQLDKISSSRKRKNKKGDTEDESDSDDEPVKKKIISSKLSTPVAKKVLTPRSSAKKPIVEAESSESDEENLMEIKKKASKNQQSTANLAEKVTAEKSAQQQATPKPQPGVRGRKRLAPPVVAVVEKSAKVAKVEEKKPPVTPTKNTAEVKTPPKAKAIFNKKGAAPAPSEKKEESPKKAVATATVEKKQSPLKKKQDEKPAAAVVTPPASSPSKKKLIGKEKIAAAPAELPQSSTAAVTAKTKASPVKARNTRSKK